MSKDTSHIDRTNTVISIRGLEKSFGTLKVLRGIDLNVYKGENVVVLGRSGTGKSVLIKIISGLLRPDKGTVNVLDNEVDTLSEKDLQALRLKIGFSFQNGALYDSMSVRGNLEFPLRRNFRNLNRSEINAAVEEVLDGVGLIQAIDQMPSGLSGGQRKRIGIARTLILRPEIMLYDETTAGLDPITSKYHTTYIIITHDLTCAKSTGDRIAMMLNGTFLHKGTFDEVFSSDDPAIKGFYEYNFIQ
jgi:phospholipid/cholesterol/gamma-HCH transport system ATP-binding protein